jgi:hypothetical protein
MAKKTAEPWEKPAPKKSRHTKLTTSSKAKAKRAAKKAGRKYPSLVDNMNAAKKQRAAAGKKKAPARTESRSTKTTAREKSASTRSAAGAK